MLWAASGVSLHTLVRELIEGAREWHLRPPLRGAIA